MSRPVQKELSWFQRFLYHTAYGPIPTPVPVVDVSQDQPLPISIRNLDYVTIAGTVATNVFAPTNEHHGLVFLAQIHVPGANIPATDEITLSVLAAGGNIAARPFWQTGIASARIFMVGGVSREAGPVQQAGGAAVYVPPEWVLRIDHASVGGGQNVTCRIGVLEQQAYYPLRLPF